MKDVTTICFRGRVLHFSAHLGAVVTFSFPLLRSYDGCVGPQCCVEVTFRSVREESFAGQHPAESPTLPIIYVVARAPISERKAPAWDDVSPGRRLSVSLRPIVVIAAWIQPSRDANRAPDGTSNRQFDPVVLNLISIE